METISEFLKEYHLEGLTVGLATFLIIGLFHPLVVKGYYYFGLGCRWAFAVAGVAFCALSLLVSDTVGRLSAEWLPFHASGAFAKWPSRRSAFARAGSRPIPGAPAKNKRRQK